MTGGSLGLRSSSYGSLQQAQAQGGTPLPAQPPPPPLRKPPKLSLGGAREKERLLPRIFKIAGRRKVGMFLLAIVSVGVVSTMFSASRREVDISGGPEGNRQLSSFTVAGTGMSSSMVSKESKPATGNLNLTTDTDVGKEILELNDVDELQDFPVFNISMFSKFHPCRDFSLPPPPSDSKRTGPRPCDVCYLPVELAMALMPSSPSESPILKNLTYYSEGDSIAVETNGGSIFGGRPSLQQRNESFNIQESMKIHCGFFKGSGPGSGSGFDIDAMDLHDMRHCRGVVVASAVFGNYDVIQQPKNISDLTKRYACFYMFVDEETESFLRNSSILDSTKKVGLWRVVVVHNLPFLDARRNGKIPKLLLHRLFPNARFSLWIDGKLELVVDPFQILERFLWRKNATFAISRHYRRFDVFVEAEANKAARKYDNASIDYQIEFYKSEGLTHYTPAKFPITSDVPEGCVIIREHIPITNLFTCLWFNEVDRFTSRDQLSFSTVRDKIMSRVNWSVEMFLDCERRNFVVQAYHRDLLEQMKKLSVFPPPVLPPPPPVPLAKSRKMVLPPVVASDKDKRTPVSQEAASLKDTRTPLPKKPSGKRARDRKSGSKHTRPRARAKDLNTI